MRLSTKQERADYRQAQITHLQTKYGARVQHVYDLIIVTYESPFREGTRPMLQIWRANAARSYAHYHFRSAQARQTYIDEQVTRAEAWISRQAQYKRERENDPSLRNRRNESQAVKRELAKYGITAYVSHGRGTAYGWLEINIGSGQQFGEHVTDEYQSHAHCPRCKANNLIHDFALQKTLTLTGRGGQYHGNTLCLTQDAWTDKKGSIAIEHDLAKLIETIPELKEFCHVD